jgi:hypothetical protein
LEALKDTKLGKLLGLDKRWKNGAPIRPATKLARGITLQIARSSTALNPATAFTNVVSGQIFTLAELGGDAGAFAEGVRRFTKEAAGSDLDVTAASQHVTDAAHSFLGAMAEGSTGKLRAFDEHVAFKLQYSGEVLNRGVAFHAGMAQYEGKLGIPFSRMSEVQQLKAVEYGQMIADQSQFMYGMVNEGPGMTGPLGALAGQYMSWNVNAMNYVGEMLYKAGKGNVKPALAFAAATGLASYLYSVAGNDDAAIHGFMSDLRMPGGPGLKTIARFFGDAAARRQAMAEMAEWFVPYAKPISRTVRAGQELANGGTARNRDWDSLPMRAVHALTDGGDKRMKYGQADPLSTPEIIRQALGFHTKRQAATEDLRAIQIRSKERRHAQAEIDPFSGEAERISNTTGDEERMEPGYWEKRTQALGR